MLNLGYKKVHKFVAEQQNLIKEQGLDKDIYWDGWEIVFFHPNPKARYTLDEDGRPNGVWNRKAGGFGYQTVVSPNAKGLWEVENRNIVRPNQRIRS